MKKRKKVLASLLAATMVVSMSLTALAAEVSTNNGQDLTGHLDVEKAISKTYTVNSGEAPNETFAFKFTAENYKNTSGEVVSGVTIPALTNVTIAFDTTNGFEGNTTTLTNNITSIEAENYPELGFYTYKVEEVIPSSKTQGVGYTEKPLYLIVTILRDEAGDKHYVAALHYETETGTKSNGFENTYDSGSLTVSKTIVGNMASLTDRFTFTVTFEAADGCQILSDIKVPENVTKTDGKYEYTFTLSNAESVTFNNIPAGATYTVSENTTSVDTNTVYNKIEENYSDDSKTISAGDQDTVAFKNEKTNAVDTGIILDSAPYVLLLALAAAGMFAVVNKKREEEF